MQNGLLNKRGHLQNRLLGASQKGTFAKLIASQKGFPAKWVFLQKEAFAKWIVSQKGTCVKWNISQKETFAQRSLPKRGHLQNQLFHLEGVFAKLTTL